MSLSHPSSNSEIFSEIPLTQSTLLYKSSKKKKQIYSRIIVGFFIIIVLSFFLFFATLGDTCNNWSIISSPNWLRFLFIMIDVVAISSLIVFANIEVRAIFYKNNKFAFWYFLIINLAFFYAISLIYLLPLYGFLPEHKNGSDPSDLQKDYNKTSIFALAYIKYLILAYVVIVLFSILVITKFGRDFWKRNLIFPLIYINIVVILGIYTMVYFLSVLGWTTFLFLAIISMSSDTMGYFFGSKFGKNKIAHKISPNKTWEGLIYGTFATLVFCLIIVGLYSLDTQHNAVTNLFLNKPTKIFQLGNGTNDTNTASTQPSYAVRGYSYYWWITAGSIILFLSILDYVGDITMSSIKRKFNIKDFSNILKSHGGILDRIDGLTCVFFSFGIIWTVICLLSGSSADVFNPKYNSFTSGLIQLT